MMSRGQRSDTSLEAIWRFPGRVICALLKMLVAIYQALISPLTPPACRFTPTCSSYARECLSKYGALRGVAKATWRLLRCHPLCRGGYDPP